MGPGTPGAGACALRVEWWVPSSGQPCSEAEAVEMKKTVEVHGRASSVPWSIPELAFSLMDSMENP